MGILGPLEYVGNEGTFPGCQGCVLRTQVEKAGEEQLLQLPGLWPALMLAAILLLAFI